MKWVSKFFFQIEYLESEDKQYVISSLPLTPPDFILLFYVLSSLFSELCW